MVAQKVELTNMENRMTASQGQVEELKREVVDQRVQLSVTQTQLQFYKDQLSVTQSQVEEMRRETTGNILPGCVTVSCITKYYKMSTCHDKSKRTRRRF